MSDDEIKLTTTNNTTSGGVKFPETPRPQVFTENFTSVKLSNGNENHQTNNNNDNN